MHVSNASQIHRIDIIVATSSEIKVEFLPLLIRPCTFHSRAILWRINAVLPSKPPIIRSRSLTLRQAHILECSHNWRLALIRIRNLQDQCADERKTELACAMAERVLVARDILVPKICDGACLVTAHGENEVLLRARSGGEGLDIADLVIVVGVLAGADAEGCDGERARVDIGVRNVNFDQEVDLIVAVYSEI